jgi:DNA-binding GntR family transcriptional regulator
VFELAGASLPALAMAPPVTISGARRRHRPQLSDEAAAYVRELIMSGQLRSGDFIRQDALADELGVSATPVREGLLALRGEGFVHLEPRRGFVVAELKPDDIRDLFDAQALLAGELAARAAEKIDGPTLAQLVEMQGELSVAARRGAADDVEELNHNFHRLLNLTAGSPKIAWMLSVAVRYTPRRFFADIDGWQRASVLDHAAVIKALRKHDAERARLAMSNHVRHAGQLLVAHFDERSSTQPK